MHICNKQNVNEDDRKITYRMYGIFAGIWNLAPGSKSISDRSTGGLMPPYRSLKKTRKNQNNVAGNSTADSF